MPKAKKIKIRELKPKIKIKQAEESGLEEEIEEELDAPVRRERAEFSEMRGASSPSLERGDIEQELPEEPAARAAEEEQTTGVRYTPIMGRYEAPRASESSGISYDVGREEDGETARTAPTLRQEQISDIDHRPLVNRGLREERVAPEEKYEFKKEEKQAEKRAKHPWE